MNYTETCKKKFYGAFSRVKVVTFCQAYTIIPIFKKTGIDSLSDYRPAAITSVAHQRLSTPLPQPPPVCLQSMDLVKEDTHGVGVTEKNAKDVRWRQMTH